MVCASTAMLVAFFLASSYSVNLFLPVALAALVGFITPDLWLRNRVRARQRRIVWSLPDFMDLLLVCVEAGLGLDQAMARVGHELRTAHYDVSDELRIYGLEVNAGSSRAQALRNLAGRTGVEGLRSFSAMLIQSDRFGTSVGRTLRIFSQDLRLRRRQAAEEAAAKLTVKLVIPLILFIFPAVLVVTAGPAVIAIVRTLFGTLSGTT
jgi:tight adherence protein C